MKCLYRALAALAIVLAGADAALAQGWPNRSIRMVVPYTPGGYTDLMARLVGQKISEALGQPIVFENKPGANAIIGTDVVAKAAPDGYTFGTVIAAHAANATLNPKLPYDTLKDFTYVSLMSVAPLIMIAHPSLPANNVKELIALLKASPGKYSYGSSGTGTIVHLASEMLKASAGVDALHVPYKGSNPATAAILGGEVTFVFSTMPPAISNAKAGKLRALAVTTAARVAPAPEVPTMVEAGVPNFEIVLYSGILGPKGMDAALVRKLNAEFAKVVQAPEIKNVYENIGADPLAMSPQEFQKRTVDEIAKFGPVVKASGAKVD